MPSFAGPAMDVTLIGHTDLAGFRARVRELLAHQVPPGDVHWILDLDGALPASPEAPQASRPRNVARAATAIVPASFTRLCEFVVLHRDAQRFDLLYRLLWRLVHEPGLRNDVHDPDMLQAQHMAHAVRRDLHKMKSNQRLRPVPAAGREWQMGCHEPAHHIVETAAPWFARRLPDPRWVLFTPDACVRCDQGQLRFAPGVPARALPAFDGPAQAWTDCFSRVFGADDAAPPSS